MKIRRRHCKILCLYCCLIELVELTLNTLLQIPEAAIDMRVYYSLIFSDGSNGTAMLTISVSYSHLDFPP